MAVVAMASSVHENVARHVVDMSNLFMHVQRVCCVGVCVGEREMGRDFVMYRLCGCIFPVFMSQPGSIKIPDVSTTTTHTYKPTFPSFSC